MNNHAILLCRISDENQADGYSLDAQEKFGIEYCQRKSLDVQTTFRFVETVSKVGKRTKFDEAVAYMKSHAKRHNYPLHLVVEKPDRLTRNFTNREQLQTLILQKRLIIHYYKDQRIMDHNCGPAEIFCEDMITSVSKYVAMNISRESKKGMREKAAQGWFPVRAPMGYKNVRVGRENKHGQKEAQIAVDETTKAAVQRMFELRATTDLSYRDIAQKIRDERLLPAGRFKRFGKSTVEYILSSPFYTGEFLWEGEWHKGRHEIIVPLKHLDAVFKPGKSKHSRRSRGFLSGFLTCAHEGCGCQIIYDPKTKNLKSTGEKKIYEYYHCTDAKFVHRLSGRKQLNVSEEHLFNEFSKPLRSIQLTEARADQISKALRLAHERTILEQRRTMDGYRQASLNLEGREDELYDDYRKGIVDEEGYNRQIKRVRAERRHYQMLLEQNQIAITNAFYETSDEILELARNAESLWKERSPEERVEMLRDVLSNQKLDGLTLQYELKKPFRVIAEMSQTEEWCPGPDWARTSCPRPLACARG